jgi:GIY-YIG catalytic domain/NUMOD3 motif
LTDNAGKSGRGFIYLLRFPNGKGYIGQTRRTVEARIRGHAKTVASNKEKNHLCNAWRKYGAPVVATIGEYPIDELNMREVQYIASYNTLSPNGYNLSGGGMVPAAMHVETRAKISAGLTGKRASVETRRKLKVTFNTPEHRAKVSSVHKGKVISPETREKLSRALKGKPLSVEQRANISASLRGIVPWNKGKMATPAHRANIAATLKGIPRPAEVRAKISATKRLATLEKFTQHGQMQLWPK